MGQPIKAHRIWRPVNRSNRETTFKPSDFLVKTPVTGPTGSVNRSVYRSEPVTHVLLNLDLNSTGFRSNRSDKPLPEGGGLTGPVGFVNPDLDRPSLSFSFLSSCVCVCSTAHHPPTSDVPSWGSWGARVCLCLCTSL